MYFLIFLLTSAALILIGQPEPWSQQWWGCIVIGFWAAAVTYVFDPHRKADDDE